MLISRHQIALLLAIALAITLFYSKRAEAPERTLSATPTVSKATTSPTATTTSKSELKLPMDNARGRVTKKPFGIYVTPDNSPTIPEHFNGYHLGTDFEIFPGEENIDVEVQTICSGKITQKRTAQGYGGLATQSCTYSGQPILVIYGHLRLSSITATVRQEIPAGTRIGVLGSAFTAETGNERKHLHLGIHKGAAATIAGYTQSAAELNNWYDALKILP